MSISNIRTTFLVSQEFFFKVKDAMVTTDKRLFLGLEIPLEVTEAIKFYEGERLRLTLINDTMMPHPIHLHGMFFDLVNGSGHHMPRKHTVIVKPADKVSVDISAEHVGDWAFHCHLLYHMHAGMMQVVSVLPTTHPEHPGRPATEPAMDMPMDHHGMNHGEQKS